MNKEALIQQLLDQLLAEPTSLYNLYEVYSLVFDINEILLGEGDIMNLFPQNNRLGPALAGEKLLEVPFGTITETFTDNDYLEIHNVFLLCVQELAA